MKPIILFRRDQSNEEDYRGAVASKFEVTTRRSVCFNNFVIGRFSVLPYYEELEKDLNYFGSELINSYSQHQYIASFNYYFDVAKYTFPTWFELHRAPDDISFVVKGTTNSRKHRWNTACFAENKRRAAEIAHELKDDVLLASQGIIYRQYMPLHKLDEALHGLPISNEYRTFWVGNQYIGGSFYWSQLENPPDITKEVIDYAQKIANIICENVNFFVLDIAYKENGDLILVEINDGQMSGLSLIEAGPFYDNLYGAVNQLCRQS